MIEVMGAQGSAQWVTARCGIPTASQFKNIITPKTLATSKSAGPYMNELLAEWIFGEPIEVEASSPYMDRGTDLEPLARKAYTIQTGREVREVGLCLKDDSWAGCSPDGLIGNDGGLEAKTPGLKKHIAYMLDPDLLVEDYRVQLHGSIWVCERDWWDIISYHPSLPDVIVRVDRDGDVATKISKAVRGFLADLIAAQNRLRDMNVEPDARPMAARHQVALAA